MSKKSIVIVDDDVLILKVLEKVLGDDYDVRAHKVSEEALQDILTSPPSLVLCDVTMPGMDGITLYNKVNEAGLSGCEFIFVSAHSNRLRTSALGHGRAHFLAKPFTRDKVLATVKELAA